MCEEKEPLYVVAVIQARMDSSRFPGKALEEIYPGATVLEVVHERISMARVVDQIIVATSMNPKDDAIAEFCKTKDFHCFRGMEENLMCRVRDAVEKNSAMPCDIIVDITADCPLVDPEHIADIVNKLIQEKLDYCSNVMERTWPDGLDIQAYTYQAFLEMAWNFLIETKYTGYNFVKLKEHFKCGNIPAPDQYRHPEWELTVDYPEDLELLRILVDWNISTNDEPTGIFCNFNTHDILNVLIKHPALLKINQRLPRHEESNMAAKVKVIKKENT